jgi:hypothetical protein
MALGAAGLAVAGAVTTGVLLGAAGIGAMLVASGRVRPPGARWPAEKEHRTDAGMAGETPVEP